MLGWPLHCQFLNPVSKHILLLTQHESCLSFFFYHFLLCHCPVFLYCVILCMTESGSTAVHQEPLYGASEFYCASFIFFLFNFLSKSHCSEVVPLPHLQGTTARELTLARSCWQQKPVCHCLFLLRTVCSTENNTHSFKVTTLHS